MEDPGGQPGVEEPDSLGVKKCPAHLTDMALMLVGRSVKSPCEGYQESCTMLQALCTLAL